MPFPASLSSERLLLRPLEPGDAAALCAYRSRPEVARYQSWESFSAEDAARLIGERQNAGPGVPGKWFQWAIIETATQTMIGDCGTHCLATAPRQMEIGITLSPVFQGRGLATEALRCMLGCLFGTLDYHRVCATTLVENQTAAALFRRAGFRQEAHFRDYLWFKGRWVSDFVFALLRRDWEQANAPSVHRK